MRISDWSSDVCSADLHRVQAGHGPSPGAGADRVGIVQIDDMADAVAGMVALHIGAGSGQHAGPGRMAGPGLGPGEAVAGDRKSVLEGKRVSVRVALGGRRQIKQKRKTSTHK